MSKPIATFAIGGVLGAALFGGVALAAANPSAGPQPRPAIVVDPNAPVTPLQAKALASAPSAASGTVARAVATSTRSTR